MASKNGAWRRSSVIFLSSLCFFTFSSVAICEDSLVLNANPLETVLSKSTSLVLNPPPLSEKDFEVTWTGTPIAGAEAFLISGSMQWIRTQDVLVIARARLHIKIPGTVFGTVRHHGAVQTFEQEADSAHAEIPVALVSGDSNPIELTVRPATRVQGGPVTQSNGGFATQSNSGFATQPEIKAKLVLKLRSLLTAEKRIHIDSSCSPYRVQTENPSLLPSSWAFIGCRLVYNKNQENLIPSLEMYVYWDGVGQKIEIDGTPTESTVPDVWPLRLRHSPGRVRFSHGEGTTKQRFQLTYRVRSELHLGTFGFGVGPYAYKYSSAGGVDDINSIAGVFTFYGSVFFNHYMRAVLFSILPVHKKIFSDTGIYLLIEQARILDNRLSINFLLGGHGLLFPYSGANYFRFSFPQGIEMVFRDFPFRRNNFTFGAFAYPFAGERSYYNLWLRWAMGPYFGELNYIKWDEIVRSGTLVGAEMWGVSVGMPLFDFL